MSSRSAVTSLTQAHSRFGRTFPRLPNPGSPGSFCRALKRQFPSSPDSSILLPMGDGMDPKKGAADPRREREPKMRTSGPAGSGLYLWLCSEGWAKFGPFEWLSFDDERRSITDERGKRVARCYAEGWHVEEAGSSATVFSNPTITTRPVRPHRNSGGHPHG